MDLLRQLCTDGYMRVPIDASLEDLQNAEQEFRHLKSLLSEDEKKNCFQQRSKNAKDYIGYREIRKYGSRSPDVRFQYVPGVENLLPASAASFASIASQLYSRALSCLAESLREMEVFLPNVHNMFFSGAPNCKLRFLSYPAERTQLMESHYDHSAFTLALHESVRGLHAGLDDERARLVQAIPRTALLFTGIEFEEAIDRRLPLTRHFVRREISDAHERVSIIFLANTTNAVLQSRSAHIQELNRIRSYPDNLYELLTTN